MNKQSIQDIDVSGKKILMRLDLNVPMDKKTLEITNNARITAALPTVRLALEKGAKQVIMCSHLGRPNGEVVEKFSLRPVQKRISELLDMPVGFAEDYTQVPEDKLVLLENLRFHKEEEGKGAAAADVKAFREKLRAVADVFVSDAFGTAHRAHSSMLGEGYDVRVSGLLLKREMDYFNKALSAPTRPYLAILGGAKVSDKIKLISNLLTKVDEMIIGGGMAYTFLKVSEGMKIGKSLYDPEGAEIVMDILAKAKELGVKLIFPVDFTTADDFSADANTTVVTMEEGIPDDLEGLDCGPASIQRFQEAVLRAGTIVWNGPVGVFELEPFAKGTRGIMDAAVEATAKGATVIVGGGDTATAAANWGTEEKLSFISTGGGASIELLQGNVMPGVEALCEK